MLGPLLRASALLAAFAASHLHAQTADADPNLGLLRDNGGAQLVNGQVRAFAMQGTRKILVGGDFVRTADGSERFSLLRMNADGTLDANFRVLIASAGLVQVNAITVADGAIYIGGRFQMVNGMTRPNIAKLTADGELVEGWRADLNGPTDTVHAIAVGPDAVYAGGDFTAQDLWGVARLDRATGAIDPIWRAQTQTAVTPTPVASGRGNVRSLLHTGTDLIVGGYFRQIAGEKRASIARVSLTAPAAVSTFDAPINGGERYAYALALSPDRGTLYIGGDFFAGSVHQHLMRVNAQSGMLDADWKPQPSAQVRTLALLGPWLYAGGSFSGTTPQPYANLMRVASTGTGARDTAWLPNPDARVLALYEDGVRKRLYVGGEFTKVGIASRNGLARIGQVVDPDVIFYDGVDIE
ncbi:delta-60 repeat domain-containing protein [Dokdonella sp.]|uniref:delta-60 repeat domain-containing protein n=1 Tax=Dokdonella sp. TaxID=2291710 RepID=UPI002636886A|nr:delta-60 repeat domain-containing protein [Dokdonella sp.]